MVWYSANAITSQIYIVWELNKRRYYSIVCHAEPLGIYYNDPKALKTMFISTIPYAHVTQTEYAWMLRWRVENKEWCSQIALSSIVVRHEHQYPSQFKSNELDICLRRDLRRWFEISFVLNANKRISKRPEPASFQLILSSSGRRRRRRRRRKKKNVKERKKKIKEE